MSLVLSTTPLIVCSAAGTTEFAFLQSKSESITLFKTPKLAASNAPSDLSGDCKTHVYNVYYAS